MSFTNKVELNNGAVTIEANDSNILVFKDANGSSTSTSFLNGGFDPTTVYTKEAGDAKYETLTRGATKISTSAATSMIAAGTGDTLNAVALIYRTIAQSLRYVVTPPTGSTYSGVVGDISFDNAYLYICYNTDLWDRIAFTGWA